MEESPAFVEFLEFLGKKIELHDFKGFELFKVFIFKWFHHSFLLSAAYHALCYLMRGFF